MSDRNRRWLPTCVIILLLVSTARPTIAQPASPEPLPAAITLDPAARDLAHEAALRPYRLALLVPFSDDPFWQSVQQVAAIRAARDGVLLDVETLSGPSASEQITQIEQAVAARYDGILLGAIDAVAIAPGILAANSAGIPVLAIDTPPIGGSVISVVGTDDAAAAGLASRALIEALDGNGKVLDIRGDLSSQAAQEREIGFRDGIAASSDISVEVAGGDWEEDTGFRAAATYLPQADEGTPTPPQPLVDGIFAAGPQLAFGAAQAVEDAQADTVTVIGFGATGPTLAAVRSGLLAGVVAELPIRAGTLAIDLMVRHLNGGDVAATVDSGAVLVTLDNLATYEQTVAGAATPSPSSSPPAG